jgi:hypothetical protein
LDPEINYHTIPQCPQLVNTIIPHYRTIFQLKANKIPMFNSNDAQIPHLIAPNPLHSENSQYLHLGDFRPNPRLPALTISVFNIIIAIH